MLTYFPQASPLSPGSAELARHALPHAGRHSVRHARRGTARAGQVGPVLPAWLRG